MSNLTSQNRQALVSACALRDVRLTRLGFHGTAFAFALHLKPWLQEDQSAALMICEGEMVTISIRDKIEYIPHAKLYIHIYPLTHPPYTHTVSTRKTLV